MAMKGSGGGGFGSRVVTERPIRTGSGSYATTPGYAGQLGQAQGTHVTRGGESNYRGEPMHSGRSFNPTKYGMLVAADLVLAERCMAKPAAKVCTAGRIPATRALKAATFSRRTGPRAGDAIAAIPIGPTPMPTFSKGERHGL